MVERPVIPKESVGGTLSAAIWVLGLVAAAQVIAVGWAMVERIEFQSPAYSPVDLESGAGRQDLMEAGSSESSTRAAVGGVSEPSEMDALSAAAIPLETGIESAKWPESAPSFEIEEPEVLELMEAATNLRGRGDLQGALARLHEADALLPGHPRIVYRVADCFAAMGMRERALEEWSRIVAMGQEKAGGYWAIADLKLRGEATHEAPSPEAELTVSNVLVERHPEILDGEEVTLRIALKARPGEEIVPGEVVVNVFFYDLVNGKDVARTTADPPHYEWETVPIDWVTQPEEILAVEYFHPTLTPEQELELGRRQYYGYIVEVYYSNALQDVLAQPRTLRSLATEMSNPLLQNRLFPNN